MIYVILGMHKSGTTLLANILHSSGVNMIDSEAEGRDYDRGGHFERSATNRINKDLLRCGNRHSLEVVRAASPDDWTDELRDRADGLIAELDRTYVDWGFKDPRTCLTYPFWRERLGTHKVLFVYRDPEEIVSHYMAQSGGIRGRLDPALATRALRAWCVYNGQVLAHARAGGMPWLAFKYADFMRYDAPFAVLRAFVGRELEDRRLGSRYRSRRTAGPVYRLAKALVGRVHGLDVEAIRRGLDALAAR